VNSRLLCPSWIYQSLVLLLVVTFTFAEHVPSIFVVLSSATVLELPLITWKYHGCRLRPSKDPFWIIFDDGPGVGVSVGVEVGVGEVVAVGVGVSVRIAARCAL